MTADRPVFVCLGDFETTWSTELYVADALRAVGCRVYTIHDNGRKADNLTRLIPTVRETPEGLPRVVFLFPKINGPGRKHPANLGSSATAATLRRLRLERPDVRVVCWTFDPVRAEWSAARSEWARAVYPHCDLFLTTDAGTSSEVGLSGARLLRQGCPMPPGSAAVPADRGLPRDEFKAPACHLGSAYGHRLGWVRDLSARVSGLKSFNHVRGDDLFDLCASVGVVVGPPWPAFPGYWSNRLYVVTGYGGLFACPEVEGMRDEGWFPDVHYLPLSPDPRDHPDQVGSIVSRLGDPRSEAVRRAGRELAVARHTYRHRAAELVRMVGEL